MGMSFTLTHEHGDSLTRRERTVLTSRYRGSFLSPRGCPTRRSTRGSSGRVLRYTADAGFSGCALPIVLTADSACSSRRSGASRLVLNGPTLTASSLFAAIVAAPAQD